MTFFEIEQRAYFYEISGEGDPFLLLHGFTGSGQNWVAHLPAFAQQRHVITVDILGHGRSTSPSDPAAYRMENVASDLLCLLDELDLPEVHLLGYSMGGRLALYLAVFYPERWRSLVLESASPGLDTAVSRQERVSKDNELADWIEANGIEAFVNRWEQLPMWASQDQLGEDVHQMLRRQRLQNDPVGLANSLRGMGTGQQPSLWPHLPALQLPTLLLAGALDNKFMTINQQMVAQMPNSILEVIKGAGHTIHLERPSAFQQSVLSFLKNVPVD